MKNRYKTIRVWAAVVCWSLVTGLFLDFTGALHPYFGFLAKLQFLPALLAAKRVLCIVPEARKAQAVYDTLNGPITESCPASIMRQNPHIHLYLDAEAAAKAYPAS